MKERIIRELAALKPGDEVAARTGGWGASWQIITIDKRTPTGRIVCGTTTFDPDGDARGDHAYYRCIEPVTAEIRKEIDERERTAKCLVALDRVLWREVPLDVLEQIVALLPKKESK